MKKSIWTAVLAAAVAMTSAVPQLAAADNVSFNLALSPGLNCVPAAAHARVTINDLGPVQNLHLEVFNLTPNTEFTTFITQHASRPFGLSWYQGEVVTNSKGDGVADYSGIFSNESFLINNDGGSNEAVSMGHIGIWFADPNDASKAGCAGITTPFDGDRNAGILVFSTSNFPDNQGPILQLGATPVAAR